jgi:hypothetical protein
MNNAQTKQADYDQKQKSLETDITEISRSPRASSLDVKSQIVADHKLKYLEDYEPEARMDRFYE